tara:strand:- start:5392 stop:8607 length:3216 start_codon:yes stop_codon:yes gene_type:complete
MEDIVKKDLIKAIKLNEQIEEQTTSSDAGSYVTPQVWAKSPSDLKSVNDPNWPKYGGPGAEYVRVKKKCKTFPYCNQGDINALEFYGPTKKKSKKRKSKKKSTTPLGRRKRKIAKDLVRTQRIKTPRGKHYNIGKWINENNGYLYYNDELTLKEVQSAMLENTMRKNITNRYASFTDYRTQGQRLEEATRRSLNRYLFEDCASCDATGGYYCGDDVNNWTAYSPQGCVPWYYIGDNINDCQDGADEMPANRDGNTGAGINNCSQAPPQPIPGCTDPTADNYDANATQDDGSCTFTVLGCIDVNANNFDPSATQDDGSCTYDILGCIDDTANNYNSQATVDDNSCDYGVDGCMDEVACNFNPLATVDDGSCYYGTDAKPCDPSAVKGCMDPNAMNYNPDAKINDDDSCKYGLKGCMDDTAINYNPDATIDDSKSCKYPQVNPCIELEKYLEGIGVAKDAFCSGCKPGGQYEDDKMCECCKAEPVVLSCDEFNSVGNQQMKDEICSLCDSDYTYDASNTAVSNNPLVSMYCECCDSGMPVSGEFDCKLDLEKFLQGQPFNGVLYNTPIDKPAGTDDAKMEGIEGFCNQCLNSEQFKEDYGFACACCEDDTETVGGKPPKEKCSFEWDSPCAQKHLGQLTGGVEQLQSWLHKRMDGYNATKCKHLQNVVNWLTKQLNGGVVGPNQPSAGKPLSKIAIKRKMAKREWAICQAAECDCTINIPDLFDSVDQNPNIDNDAGGGIQGDGSTPTGVIPCWGCVNGEIEQHGEVGGTTGFMNSNIEGWCGSHNGNDMYDSIDHPQLDGCGTTLEEQLINESLRKKIINMKLTEQSNKKAQGYRIYAKAHEMSGKSNDEGLAIAKKKIANFMKNDGEPEVEPKMYRNSKKQDEFIEDVYYSSGQTGLKFNHELTDQQKERMGRYLKGSKLTGNAVTGDVANVTTTNAEGGDNKTGEMLSKAAKRRAEKEDIGMRMANNDRRYSPDTQVTTNAPLVKLKEDIIDTPKQILELTPKRYKKDGIIFEITNGTETKTVKYEAFRGKKGGHIIILDSSNPTKLNEQLSRMKTLINHSSKTRHDKFR